MPTYWMTNFLFDYFFKYSILAVSGGILILIYDLKIYTGSFEIFSALMVLIFLYGLSVIALTYITSFIFNNIGNA